MLYAQCTRAKFTNQLLFVCIKNRTLVGFTNSQNRLGRRRCAPIGFRILHDLFVRTYHIKFVYKLSCYYNLKEFGQHYLN